MLEGGIHVLYSCSSSCSRSCRTLVLMQDADGCDGRRTRPAWLSEHPQGSRERGRMSCTWASGLVVLASCVLCSAESAVCVCFTVVVVLKMKFVSRGEVTSLRTRTDILHLLVFRHMPLLPPHTCRESFNVDRSRPHPSLEGRGEWWLLGMWLLAALEG
jgi:hypothetical protein